MTMDQEFIEYVVKSIVSEPDDVHIDRSIDERGVLLELTVNPDDLGRVIGKRGNTAQSMRTLLRALGTKDSARYNLKIIDNGDPDYDKNKNNDDSNDNSSKDTSSNDDSNDYSNDDNSDDNSDDSNDDVADNGSGAGQWAHMSSDDDETDDSSTTETEASQDDESSTSSTSQSVEQTKKELADLDDLEL